MSRGIGMPRPGEPLAAVVAAEIRGLAQRSSAAARQVKELIAQGGEAVGDGARLVGVAGTAMRGMHGQVSGVSTLMAGLREAAAEQDAGISQVNLAVRSLDQGTQRNAAMAEQARAAAENLQSQARRLTRVVSSFILDPVDGAATAAPGRAANFGGAGFGGRP